MQRRHLPFLAAISALGLAVLQWTGGAAGSSVRLGPFEWRTTSAPSEVRPLAERLQLEPTPDSLPAQIEVLVPDLLPAREVLRALRDERLPRFRVLELRDHPRKADGADPVS